MNNQQVLYLMEIIEEQQELIKELLELYPESPQKLKLLEVAERTRGKMLDVKTMVKFIARSDERTK